MSVQLHLHKCTDSEAAGESPEMLENPDLQQEFIYKVYLIIAVQFLLTIFGVAAVVVSIHPLAYLLSSNSAGLPFYLIISLTAITAILCLWYCYHLDANYLLLGLLTIALSFLIGLTCAVASGKVILECAILTCTLVVNLTLYTFWATSKGHDFDFLGPFLFGATVVVVLFSLVQILFPIGRIFVIIHGRSGSITFCCYIVCVTDGPIIKNYYHDKYIWAAVCLYVDIINLFCLYVDIINLFLLLLTIFKATDL